MSERAPEREPGTPYLTVPEVAALARCEQKAVRRAIHSGQLRAFNPVQRLLIRECDAIEWVESRPVRGERRAPRAHQRARASRPGSDADLRAIERELTSAR